MKLKRLCVLGSTGSIGNTTLALAARHPDHYEVFALSGSWQSRALVRQCIQHQPRYAAVSDPTSALQLSNILTKYGCPTEVTHGASAVARLASHPQVDTVMVALSGTAALQPSLAAAAAGKRLLLANRSALVLGGPLFLDAARRSAAKLLPVNGRLSAIHQCVAPLGRDPAGMLSKIMLTTSFVPSRTMDGKASVNSATMMDRVFDTIEAARLFTLPPEKIDVMIHPQNVVQATVEFVDGAVLAQLGATDMRSIIAYSLACPGRVASGSTAFDLVSRADLSFEKPDPAHYPSLLLARQVLQGGAGASAVLSAANDEAVSAYLFGNIPFAEIHAVVSETLGAVNCALAADARLDDLLDLHNFARRHAAMLIDKRRLSS